MTSAGRAGGGAGVAGCMTTTGAAGAVVDGAAVVAGADVAGSGSAVLDTEVDGVECVVNHRGTFNNATTATEVPATQMRRAPLACCFATGGSSARFACS